MKRLTKSVLFAVACAACVSRLAEPAIAGCHGRSGGYSSTRSYSVARSYPSHSNYSYSKPVYSQPVRIIHSQPVTYSQSSLPPINSIPQLPQTQFSQTTSQIQSDQVLATQMMPQQTPLVQQGNPMAQMAGQLKTAAPQPGGISAEASALQALGGFAPPQTTASQTTPGQPVQQTPVHVGTWTAQLGNGASVKLTLQTDGTFRWTATNAAGNNSSFQGRYVVENGTLTLARSTDNQQLGGSMTVSGLNAFSFKLADSNAAAIEFQRS